MNTSEEISSDQDPDYAPDAVNNEKQQKIYEEHARSNTARKISAIVNKEFSQEIDAKEKEILLIQERLHKALKTLHLLRYVIVTDYYNRKQCLLPQAGVVKQTRIHPAVKQLIGKSPRIPYEHAVPSTSKAPQLLNGCEYSVASTSKLLENDVHEPSELKVECKTEKTEKRNLENEDSRPKKIPRYVPPKCANPEPPCPSRGVRHKVQKRIVVGNISKWIPPDWREDAASHKWTMYVRSSKEDVEISDFVSKVRFFLHPSYRPNDVVEVTSAPFHLSRRGWGEFPLRVQLHFKNPLNKPMDIIHHLKLDRTYTGLQTLGSETLVDVWIHTAELRTHGAKLEDTDGYPEDDSSKRISPVKEGIVTNNIRNISNNMSTYLEKETSSVEKEIQERTSDSYEEEHKVPQNAFTNENIIIKDTSGSSKEYTSMGNIALYQDSILQSSASAVKQECDKDSSLNECCGLPELDSTMALTDVNYVIKTEPADCVCNIASDTKKLLSYVHLDHNYLGDKFFKDCNYTVEQKLRHNELQINQKFETQNMHFSDSLKNVSNVTDVPRSKRLTSILRRNINSTNSRDPKASMTFTTQNKTSKSVNSPLQDEQSAEHKTIVHDSTVLQKGSNVLETDSHASLRLMNGSPKDITGLSQNVENHASGTTLNRRSSDIQKVLSSTKSHVSDLQPLKISIPPAFETSTRKLLIVKNSRSFPTEIIKTIATKTEDRSLLKKSFHNTNGPSSTKPSGISVLKVKPMNSLMLNVNSDVPALKIVSSHACSTNVEDGTASSNRVFNSPIFDVQEEKPTKARVTLGKDKHKIQSKRELYEETLRSIETARIQDVEGFLRFAIRRLPMITQNASDPDYKRLHPYACVTEEEFASHNIGKQRAYEWYRAKILQSLVQRKVQTEDRLWTMKEIIIWSRIHGYTPLFTTLGGRAGISSKGAKNVFDSMNSSTFSTCTEPVAFRKWIESCQGRKRSRAMDENDAHDSQDEDIDIIHIDEPLRVKSELQKIDPECSKELQNMTALELDKNLFPLFDFVSETARDIGIRLLPEEIVPNVPHCMAARVMMRVIECFVEDLVRASFAKACERNCEKGYPKIISLDDVRGALANREEFDIFTNEGLGTQHQPPTSN